MTTAVAGWPAGYSERPAPRALGRAALCAWAQVIPPGGAGSSVLVLPDACADLIWEAGRGAFVAGPDTGPVPTQLAPGTVMFGIRFRPGAGGRMLGVPLSELRDQRVDLADVRQRLAAALPADLDPAIAARRLLATAPAMPGEPAGDLAVMRAARVLERPGARIRDVAASLGLSERQLLRRWQAAVGYGPKTFERIVRFQRFVASLDAAAPPAGIDLAMAATAAGYADQAHLTRECARLAGLTPAALGRLRRPVAAGSGGRLGAGEVAE